MMGSEEGVWPLKPCLVHSVLLMGQSHMCLVLLWFHEFVARSCARDSILPHLPHPPGLRLFHLSSSMMFPELGGVGYIQVRFMIEHSTAVYSPSVHLLASRVPQTRGTMSVFVTGWGLLCH